MQSRGIPLILYSFYGEGTQAAEPGKGHGAGAGPVGRRVEQGKDAQQVMGGQRRGQSRKQGRAKQSTDWVPAGGV